MQGKDGPHVRGYRASDRGTNLKKQGCVFVILMAFLGGLTPIKAQTPAESPSSSPSSQDTSSPDAPLADSEQGCQKDVSNFQTKREKLMAGLENIARKNKGALDPVAACPLLREVVTLDKAYNAYLEKNKHWCGVPDEALEAVSESSKKNRELANQACQLADQVRRAKQNAIQQQGGAAPPPLPRGPL